MIHNLLIINLKIMEVLYFRNILIILIYTIAHFKITIHKIKVELYLYNKNWKILMMVNRYL